jgi:hypothetical protein
MAPRLPRDPYKIGSFSELRSHYTEAIKQLDECKRMKGATNEVLRTTADKVRGAKDEAKKAHREVVALTKREHARSKEVSSAKFATSAATALIISYQIVEVSGGFGKWAPVFEHEATIGVLQVVIGSIFAFAMRPLH